MVATAIATSERSKRSRNSIKWEMKLSSFMLDEA
jgi:hypothetical protein